LLKSAHGKVIGVGDQVNVVQGNQVRSRLIFTAIMDESMMEPRFSKRE
jgi:hypothetical protein